jgi:hypothetical protein
MDPRPQDQICLTLRGTLALPTGVEALLEEGEVISIVDTQQMTEVRSGPGVARGIEGFHENVIAL